MELDGSTFREIGQAEKDKYQVISLMCGVKQQRETEGKKQQHSHRIRELTKSYQMEKDKAG